MSNKGKYRGSFFSTEEFEQQKLSEALEASRSNGEPCCRRRIQMVTSKLSRGKRRH